MNALAELIRYALAADQESCIRALCMLRGDPVLVGPRKLKEITGLHPRTLRRRGLKPCVKGGKGRQNLYDAREALRLIGHESVIVLLQAKLDIAGVAATEFTAGDEGWFSGLGW